MEIRMLLPNTQSPTHSKRYRGNIQHFLGVLAPDPFYSVLQMPGKYSGWTCAFSTGLTAAEALHQAHRTARRTEARFP